MTRPQVFTFITNQKLSWLLQLGSCFFWVTSFIYPNEKHMHGLQTSLSRAIVGLFLNYILMRYSGGSYDLRNSKMFFLVNYRCLSNVAMGMFTAFIMFYLPMPVIYTIGNLSSVITAGIQHYFYDINISVKSRVLIFVSFIGVIVYANSEYINHKLWPSQDGSYQRQSQFKNYEKITGTQSFLLSLSYVGCVIIWSYGLVLVKYIKVHVYELNLHNNIVLLLITGLAYPTIPQERKSSIQTITISFFTSGFLVFLAQLCFVSSLQVCSSVGIMMMLNTLNILIAYIYSVVLYKEKIDFISFLGLAIALACIFFIISDKYK